MVASYEVRVTGAYGSKVNIGGGSISYLPFGGSISAIHFNQDSIVVFQNLGLCSNSSGSNAILSEFGGTFGSGVLKNRAPSPNVPSSYTYTTFSANMPNDYYYGVSNNTSVGGAGYTASNTWAIPDPTGHRVFQVWDIIGDHTGALNQALGNPATDTTKSSGGYMVVINSSYRTDTAFLDTVSNLCPNTYYQYYAWFRNICSHCGCDSNGKGASTAGYVPTAAGDSSGVHPNMTFSVNGYDYYTTGNILYSGQWVKKGFTYLTGPSQTTMVINVRNNAPGGGGNDWVIDDIGVATCLPNIALTPNKPDTLCQGADDTVRFQVSAFFNNITVWKLQQSTNLGATWTAPGNDTTGQADTGNATAVYNPLTGLYAYTITRYYRVSTLYPEIEYRIAVATTSANLANSGCSFTATTPKIIVAVNCNIVLPTAVTFHGQLKDGFAALQWQSANESSNTIYTVERSEDQVNYESIGTIEGIAGPGQGASYSFTDPKAVNGNTFYRLNIGDNSLHKYSQVVLLSNTSINFAILSLANPFSDHLSFNLSVPQDGVASIQLFDMLGRILRIQQVNVNQGLNNEQIYGLDALPTGSYVLRAQFSGTSTAQKLLKYNR
jgi:hypothetical protein